MGWLCVSTCVCKSCSDFLSFYHLICVWEWLKASLLSVCCMVCGYFKAWLYQSWHLNAEENAGQACSSWGSCHQTMAMWNNGDITWIHWVRAESLLPSLSLSVFKIVPRTTSAICTENISFPFSSFPCHLWIFQGGRLLFEQLEMWKNKITRSGWK